MRSPRLPDANQARRAPRDQRLLIRAAMPVIVAALLAGVVNEYRRSRSALQDRFSEKQAQLARQIADRLSEGFTEVHKFLALASLVADEAADHARARSFLERVLQGLAEHGAIAVACIRPNGRAPFVVGRPANQIERFWASNPHCRDNEPCLDGPYRSPFSRAGWVFLASAALPASGGHLAIILDWDKLRATIERLTSFGEKAKSWVVDDHGRLILHAEHRVELGQKVLMFGGPCRSCHVSFEVHRQMVAGATGTGQSQVKGGQPKIVAYRPFRIGPRRWWSLAVATPASVVGADVNRSLVRLGLFTGAILLVMITGAILLDRQASRRLRETAAFNRDLEHKVAERTAEIHDLYKRLSGMQADFTRVERLAVAGEMAAIVTHEIRTPLNALSINAQRIMRWLKRGADADRAKALEALGTLEGEIQRLNSLLEQHVARVRHRPTNSRPISVNDTVRAALGFMEAEGSRHRVRMLTNLQSDLPRARADAAKLQQVLLNILLNAIQAMPDGGDVTVSTDAADGMVHVRVQDTGPGIAGESAEELAQVFKPFVTTKEDGTGLGLAICARLVRGMDGKIGVTSKPGQGACFVVSLPLAESDDRASSEMSPRESPGAWDATDKESKSCP